MIDGNATTSVSAERRFVSPNLQPGRDYQYTLVAEVNRNGQMMRQMQRITVRAGEQTPVQFTFTEPAVTASR
ncbi:MAG: TIGR03000 domain-containing protein [Gemmataceae bacterium]|nr:TIGR03000 domain-containing protein [Gemmataceae bacterium]